MYLNSVEIEPSHFYVTLVKQTLTESILCRIDRTKGIYTIDGMSGGRYRYFINTLVRKLGKVSYLEVGSWMGSTLCSAVHGNNVHAVAIDNWSQFGGPKDIFIQNLTKYRTENVTAEIIESDFRKVSYAELARSHPPFNVYLFDGPHEEIDQRDGLAFALPALDDVFIFICDDWNWSAVRSGTHQALEENELIVLHASEIRTSLDGTHGEPRRKESDWHNGYFIAVLKKPAAKESIDKPVAHASANSSLSLKNTIPEILEYSGEFGPELVLFLPFCAWLSRAGLLKSHRIKTYRGMRCFYDDLECLEIIEKEEPRGHVLAQDRPPWLPVRDEHTFDNLGRPYSHFYPDLREKFRKLPFILKNDISQRPILVIHNKHNSEWGGDPVNYIDTPELDIIFRLLKFRYTIIYIRHGIGDKDPAFSDDHNVTRPFADRAVLDKHPEVLCFDDLYLSHKANGGTQDLNTFKNVIYSRCHHFISSQGGGAHHISLFYGSLLVILHRRGSETQWAYGHGYYGFMAKVPPIRAICPSGDDLLRALPLFFNTKVTKDRVLVGTENADLLARYSP